MKKATLHEVAKLAAGLVLGDLLALFWYVMHGSMPASFFGMTFSPDTFMPAFLFDVGLFLVLIHYGWNIGKMPALRERSYLLVAGTIFAIVAVAHLFRTFSAADIVLLGWVVPLWLSWIGVVIATYLAYMSFHLALSPQRRAR